MNKQEFLHYEGIFFEDGKRLGSVEERRNIAKKLIDKGVDIDIIYDVCSLDRYFVVNLALGSE